MEPGRTEVFSSRNRLFSWKPPPGRTCRFFFELQVNRLGRDDRDDVRTGEVHAHFRNLLSGWGNDLLGIKVGRVDIPFTDGRSSRSTEDNQDKASTFKIFGNPTDSLYLSTSVMRNGSTGRSAWQFAGSRFQPVGASHESTLGDSPSSQVDAHLYELDAKFSFGEKAYVSGSFGRAFVDDPDSTFDRDFTWFSLEPRYWITPRVYAVARYSEVGTYDSDQGYHFDGKITAGGNTFFGYDTKRFQRLSAGLGWRPNQRVLFKFELGHDWFEVIDASPFTPDDDDRLLYGFELVLGF